MGVGDKSVEFCGRCKSMENCGCWGLNLWNAVSVVGNYTEH